MSFPDRVSVLWLIKDLDFTVEKKNSKQNRNRLIKTENKLRVAIWEVGRGMGKWVKEIKRYKLPDRK